MRPSSARSSRLLLLLSCRISPRPPSLNRLLHWQRLQKRQRRLPPLRSCQFRQLPRRKPLFPSHPWPRRPNPSRQQHRRFMRRQLRHRSNRRTPAARPVQLLPRRRIASLATPTLHRLLPACLPGVSSCPKPARVRFTRHPWWLRLHLSPAPAIRRPEFRAADRSSTAGPLAALAATSSALPEALPDRARFPAVPVPSIPPAPRLAVTPEPVVLGLPERAPALALVPDPGRLVPAALALVPALVALRRRPAKRRARSVPLPEAVADARSIPRPKKAR
jgi:hypothetical protein